MPKTTKQQRCIAAFEHYRTLIGNRPWTSEEVAAWMEANGLEDVPGVRDSPEACAVWDARFEEVKKQQD